jgi:hypothetical protein
VQEKIMDGALQSNIYGPGDDGGEPARRRSGGQRALDRELLRRETRQFRGTGGISEENRGHGFRPAFFDTGTRTAYLSRFADGAPAPCHILDGLPEEVVLERNAAGRVSSVRSTLISGFLFDGRFYNREEAARKLGELN